MKSYSEFKKCSFTKKLLKLTSVKFCLGLNVLTHWGWMLHICISNLINITGSDNGLSHGRRQAITWTNAGILSIRTLGTNFSEILSEIPTFSFKKIHLKMSSAISAAILSQPQYVNSLQSVNGSSHKNCGCLVTWFCNQLIAKPGNKTATPSLPHPNDVKGQGQRC